MTALLPLLVLEASLASDPGLSPAIRRFETSLSVKLVPVRAAPAESRFPPYSDARVHHIESLLQRARTEAAALAEVQAWSALAEVEAELRAHPELPQSAWLMAERLTLAAKLARTSRPAEAAEMVRRARALEPERAAPFGATDPTGHPEPDAVTITVRGLTARDELVWNGERAVPPLARVPGEHHVRVLRLGELVWAGWVSISPENPTLTLDLPTAPACSAADLAIERTSAEQVTPYPDVACGAWAVVRRGPSGIELAVCQGSRCGPFRPDPGALRALRPSPGDAPSRARRPQTGPDWLTIALVGAGATLGTVFVLWQAGAFSSTDSPPARFTYTGFVPPEP
ncbi:MAG: hypothetical protein DIU78_015720 [Pseudomonadota bacterium]